VRAEQVTDPLAYHGEGPVWSERWGGLRWVDMLAGDVLSLVAQGTIVRSHVGNIAAAIRPRRQGGAVIGVERGFALEEADGSLTHLGELWSDTNVRMNEGGCDPDGRFYCGSMAYTGIYTHLGGWFSRATHDGTEMMYPNNLRMCKFFTSTGNLQRINVLTLHSAGRNFEQI